MVLFAFQQQPVAQGGKYLGEFKVTAGDGTAKTIEIAPNLPLTDEDRQRLAQAKGPLTLYFVMPVDDAKLYAAMTPEERRRCCRENRPRGWPNSPAPSVRYAITNTSSTKTRSNASCWPPRSPPAKTICNGSNRLKRKREEEVQFRQGESVALSADREKILYEQKVIHEYLQALQKQLVDVRADWQASLSATIQTARKIRRIQLKAAEEIDRATGEQANLDAPAKAVD